MYVFIYVCMYPYNLISTFLRLFSFFSLRLCACLLVFLSLRLFIIMFFLYILNVLHYPIQFIIFLTILIHLQETFSAQTSIGFYVRYSAIFQQVNIVELYRTKRISTSLKIKYINIDRSSLLIDLSLITFEQRSCLKY